MVNQDPAHDPRSSAPLLRIENLSVVFDTDEGPLHAVDSVSIDVRHGEVLGLVGESGCGKSVTALSILRLIPTPPGRITSGRMLFEDRDLLSIPPQELRTIRGRRISMIFQEPMTALSPLHRIGDQIVEALRVHERGTARAAREVALQWLGRVGIPDPAACMLAFPHELSGGMRQRVMIAMALVFHPSLVVADEPTTALDVTVQAQVLRLMLDMKERDMSMLLITHDMGIIWETCDRVAVMYAGQVVELGAVREVLSSPLHPYTRALIAAAAPLQKIGRLSTIEGQVPSPRSHPPGCRFSDRCPLAFKRCRREAPELLVIGDRRSRCHLQEGATP